MTLVVGRSRETRKPTPHLGGARPIVCVLLYGSGKCMLIREFCLGVLGEACGDCNGYEMQIQSPCLWFAAVQCLAFPSQPVFPPPGMGGEVHKIWIEQKGDNYYSWGSEKAACKKGGGGCLGCGKRHGSCGFVRRVG